jgi:cytochrome P450
MALQGLPPAVQLLPHQQWQLISQPRVFTAKLRARHGPLVNLRIRGDAFVLILSAEGARDVLSADPLGYDAFFKESFTGLGGPASLWVLGGQAHHRERQLVAPAFHARAYRRYGETIRAITRQHLTRWQSGQTLKMLEATLALSLDVIMRVVFGPDDSALVREGRAIIAGLLPAVRPVIVFVPELQRRWFPAWTRFARGRDAFWAWSRRYVAARRAYGGQSDDVVGLMLSARYEDGSAMDDAGIGDQLITILMAGHETTATALAWALYELGRHPAELARLRAEVEALGPDPDPAQVVRLPYLSAICNETLRLHTLLAEVPRLCLRPLECLGYEVPAGHAVSISVMAIHHDPVLYPQPDNFIPERFIERSFSVSEFLPFGGGDRRCLGAGLSDYEMRIALAEIVSHWDFEPARAERDIRHDIAMGPKYGVPLRLLARREPVFTQSEGERVHA